MDARVVSRIIVLLGITMVLSLALFPPSSICNDAEQDSELDLLLQDLSSLKDQARNLAQEVAVLQRTQKALPLPAAAEPQPLELSPATSSPMRQLKIDEIIAKPTEEQPHAVKPHTVKQSPPQLKESADAIPLAPLPITKEAALKRVRQTPECIEAINVNWPANNSFTSQYSQDWFLFVNYFHHIDKGFYLDIGANAPKSLSNTWFLDVCLGWEGVCVEADPGLGQLLREQRSCKVVSTCVDSSNRTLALQAAGIAVGHVVPLEEKNDRGKVMQCVTLAQIVEQNNLKHIDFLSLDVEDHEMHVLQTLPEESDGLTIDIVLIENEKTSRRVGRCHNPNLLRYPFWLRGFALVGFHGLPQGDDLWVKIGRPHLWRRHVEYARRHPTIERTRLQAYRTLLPELYRNPVVINKFMKIL